MAQQKYTDFRKKLEPIIEASIDPEPINGTIALIKKLKNMGYTVLGSTNQDYLQHKAYRKKMSQKGVDLTKLFDGVIVVRTNHLDAVDGSIVKDDSLYTKDKNNIYMITKPRIAKPSKNFYEVIRAVGQTLNPEAKIFIHIDDKDENLKGAQELDDFKTILFYLPQKKAKDSSDKEIADAIQNVKEGLKAYNITIDQ